MRERGLVVPPPSDHYSYTVYADRDHARGFDRARFGGPIGEHVASDQAAVLNRLLGDVAGVDIVDVGTGTGRAALQLAARGARVTGIDASAEMLAVAREHAVARALEVTFVQGDAHALTLADRSFDTAVCLRVLMHTPRWDVCIGQLCRVAARRVLLDYPSAHSTALIQSLIRKARLDGDRTEQYRVFLDREIEGALGRHGFRIREVHRQFVLPIALHKAIGSLPFTRITERWLRRTGLIHLVGSPVTVLAERA